MDASTFTDRVKESCAQELDRLGSEKALVAETAADLSTDSVLEAAARAELRAEATVAAWADDEDTDAQAAFERVASQEREHAARIIDRLGSEPDVDDDDLHRYLRSLDETPERIGAGLVGRPLASSRTLLQVINFFVNESDETTANTFRAIRSETDALVDEGASLLEDVCETDEEWNRAENAARETIRVAYEAYAETLEGMGINPKPVC